MLPCFLECQPFGLILDALQDGVTIYDRNGDLIWINDKACQILGVPCAELVGRNVSEIASLPTVQTIITQEFARRSPDECRNHSTRIEDYASPGYMVFTNGKKMLYLGTYVRDEDGAMQYAIYTIREATDLDEARRKIDELQKLTALYQDQLRTLHLSRRWSLQARRRLRDREALPCPNTRSLKRSSCGNSSSSIMETLLLWQKPWACIERRSPAG